MKKLLILFAFLFVICAGFLIAQEAIAEIPQFDPEVVNKILITGVGGLSVAALTEMVKRMFKAQGVLAYVISGVVSIAAAAFGLLSSGSFNIGSLAIYSVAVFLTANGIYKFAAKAARHE